MNQARAAILLAIGLLSWTVTGGLAPAVGTEAADEVLDLLQVSPEQRRRLVRGEIISYPVAERGERELAVGLAIFVLAPPSQSVEYLISGQLIAQDAAIADFGVVPDQTSPEALVGPRFTGGERDEAESLLDASAGSRFNLSSAEIETLRALKGAAGSPARGGGADMVADAYRRLLRQRVQAYQQGGLAAIAPYARSDGAVTDPGAELRGAASDADRLARYGTELREALLRYPAPQSLQMTSRYYWIKRRVQRRPHLSLLHQIAVTGRDPSIVVERYFYVGHSYNAAEIITGAHGYQDGTVVFTTSRFSTDEVLGVGNQLKRSVGRAQLRDEMRKRLDKLRAALSRPPSVQSP
jgi:hypothetical protein